MPLPRLWSVIEGFGSLSKIEHGGAEEDEAVTKEERESNSFALARSFGKKTELECLPPQFQNYLKTVTIKDGGRRGK